MLQVSSDSQMKKLEEQLSEANRRGDDLQRSLTELSVAKNRLTGTSTCCTCQTQHNIFIFISFCLTRRRNNSLRTEAAQQQLIDTLIQECSCMRLLYHCRMFCSLLMLQRVTNLRSCACS